MSSYNPAEWQSFFVAITGAAAALTGLLFVAVSINLDRILKGPRFLPGRAAETVATLLLVLASSALGLVPQNTRLLGTELLAIAVPMVAITTSNQVRHWHADSDDPSLWLVSRMLSSAVGTIPATLAGASLAARWGGGFYWLVPAALLGIAGAVYSAWVLLVEIVR